MAVLLLLGIGQKQNKHIEMTDFFAEIGTLMHVKLSNYLKMFSVYYNLMFL